MSTATEWGLNIELKEKFSQFLLKSEVRLVHYRMRSWLGREDMKRNYLPSCLYGIRATTIDPFHAWKQPLSIATFQHLNVKLGTSLNGNKQRSTNSEMYEFNTDINKSVLVLDWAPWQESWLDNWLARVWLWLECLGAGSCEWCKNKRQWLVEYSELRRQGWVFHIFEYL